MHEKKLYIEVSKEKGNRIYNYLAQVYGYNSRKIIFQNTIRLVCDMDVPELWEQAIKQFDPGINIKRMNSFIGGKNCSK